MTLRRQGEALRNRSTPKVSVIVPAFNACRTIRETLGSALGQTYGNLEVIVIDDGSTDNTSKIIQEVASGDGRVRVIQQLNAGVAAARNTGILQSAGDFIAPLDADDLWHPSCIEKRMAVLLTGDDNMCGVYAGSRLINKDGYVISSQPIFTFEGHIFSHLLCLNIIGNGSSLLMRKEAVLAVGGYESWLRTAGAEGCEDSLLQFRLASKYRFGCVPEYLVGYMKRPDSMSSDIFQMFDSMQRVFEQAEMIAPSLLKPLARLRGAETQFVKGYHMLKRGRALKAIELIIRAHIIDARCGITGGTFIAERRIQSSRAKKGRRTKSGNISLRQFRDYDPKEDVHSWIGYLPRRRLAWIATNDRHIGSLQSPDQERVVCQSD